MARVTLFFFPEAELVSGMTIDLGSGRTVSTRTNKLQSFANQCIREKNSGMRDNLSNNNNNDN